MINQLFSHGTLSDCICSFQDNISTSTIRKPRMNPWMTLRMIDRLHAITDTLFTCLKWPFSNVCFPDFQDSGTIMVFNRF